jgi:outer membrane biosynthesis protein TonB
MQPEPGPDQSQAQHPPAQTSDPQAEPDLVQEPQEQEQPEEKPTPEQEQSVDPEPPALAAQPLPLTAPSSGRISSSTTLEGSARDLVNPDGSLIQPRPSGPLAGLRQRFTP